MLVSNEVNHQLPRWTGGNNATVSNKFNSKKKKRIQVTGPKTVCFIAFHIVHLLA